MKIVVALVTMLTLASTLSAGALGDVIAPPATQVVSGARLEEVATRLVRSIVDDSDHKVQPESRLSDQQVPAGKVTIATEDVQYNPTYIAIPMLISVDGKPVKTVFMGFHIISYMHTAVAARDLPSGSILSADDVTMGRVPNNGHAPIDPSSLVGRKLMVTLAHGTPVYMEQTAINQIVSPGQPVLYILHDGGVAVSADVVARTGGGMGQTVAVYNPATRKALSGVVTGPGTVEYTLPGDAGE